MKRVLAVVPDEESRKTIRLNLGAGFHITFVRDAAEAEGEFDLVVTLPSATTLAEDQVRVDLAAQQAYVADTKIDLTGIEFRLLVHFLKNPDQAFTREELLARVWGEKVYVLGRTIDKHVSGLRKKLLHAGCQLETVEGVGYRWVRRSFRPAGAKAA